MAAEFCCRALLSNKPVEDSHPAFLKCGCLGLLGSISAKDCRQAFLTSISIKHCCQTLLSSHPVRHHCHVSVTSIAVKHTCHAYSSRISLKHFGQALLPSILFKDPTTTSQPVLHSAYANPSHQRSGTPVLVFKKGIWNVCLCPVLAIPRTAAMPIQRDVGCSNSMRQLH